VGAHLLDAGIGLVFTVTAIVLGSPLTTWVFRRVDRDARTSPQVTKAASTLRGGRVIGWLERAAVLLTVIAGWPEGVALVVALKGLGRYGELRGATEGTAERFLIGSFTSLLFAGALAVAARAAIEAT
jgi:hypothetical protein